jgi:hypothetical protein
MSIMEFFVFDFLGLYFQAGRGTLEAEEYIIIFYFYD